MLFGTYAFQGNDNDYFEPRLQHQTEKKVEQKSHSLANWSVIFSSQWTEGMIPEKGFGTTQYTYLLEGAKLQNWKQIAHWHQVWREKKQ